MSFAVGLLYSIQELLDFVTTTAVKSSEFQSASGKFVLSAPDDVLGIAQACHWIEVRTDGYLAVTLEGRVILQATEASTKLRCQIKDLIRVSQPSWAKKLMHGREEALSALPVDVRQCFHEGGLLEAWTKDLIIWWDGIGQQIRGWRSERSQQISREAEGWSFEYEKERTKAEPYWQALDSAFAGYDIESVNSTSDPTVLRVEVKSSEHRPKEAHFYFSQNECRVAETSGNYVFHLWFVSAAAQLFVVPFDSVAAHLPKNFGKGRWETARIPYSPFLGRRVL